MPTRAPAVRVPLGGHLSASFRNGLFLSKRAEFGGQSGASAAPIRWKISRACRNRTSACVGVAAGQGAPALAGQRVRLIPGAGDGAGQVQGLPVAPLGLREVTADPVQHPSLVERHSLTTPVAEVAVHAQGLVQGLGRGREITRQPPHGSQEEEGGGLTTPGADVAGDAHGLLQGLGRGRVLTRPPPHVPEEVEDVDLADPVAEVAVDAQRLLQRLGRGWVLTRPPPRRTRGR